MSWLERPALVLSVTIRIIRLNPDDVADQPSALCRYIGRKILRQTIEPQPNECAAMVSRAAGSDRMAIGISGSTAVRSRTTKAGAQHQRGSRAAREPAQTATDSARRQD